MLKRHKVIFLAIYFHLLPILIFAADDALPQDPNFYNISENTWEIMKDSRKVRSLKEANQDIREAFDDTLRKDYAYIQNQIVTHLKNDPKYLNANIAVQEFRTPGAEPGSINADMDARVLIEKAPGGEWIEIDRREWQNVMNRAIAEKTGYIGPMDNKSLQDNASQYRQLATDQYHVEASQDYADQTKELKKVNNKDGSSKWVIEQSSSVYQMRDPQTGELKFEKDGSPMFESIGNVVKVKNAPNDSNITLKDAEGLALMYYEKGNEQFRQYQDALEKGKLDKANMHLSESAVQVSKQAKTLQSMRNSYERRGFDVGVLPDNMNQAMNEITKFKGDLDSNPLELTQKLQNLGYKDIDDFNKKMGGQLESLKLSTPKKMKSPKIEMINISESINKIPSRSIGNNISTGYHAYNQVQAVIDFYQTSERIRSEAKSGQHLYIDIDQDDSILTENIKIYGMAAFEISGIPQAMDAGFEADSRAKERIQQAIREGRAIDPIRETAQVLAEVSTGAVRSVLLDQVQSAIDKGQDIYGATDAYYTEYRSNIFAEETTNLLNEHKKDAQGREEEFGFISSIKKHIGSLNGDLIVAPVTVRDPLYFSVDREASWNNQYIAEWEITGMEMKPYRKSVDLDQPDAHYFMHDIANLPSGKYMVKLQIREKSSGLIAKSVSTNFEIGNINDKQADIGVLNGHLEYNNTWNPVNSGASYQAGQRVKLIATPLGYWDDNITVEWAIDGNTLKNIKANKPGSNEITWTLDDSPKTRISARLLNQNGKIIAYKSFELRLAKKTQEKETEEEQLENKPAKKSAFVCEGGVCKLRSSDSNTQSTTKNTDYATQDFDSNTQQTPKNTKSNTQVANQVLQKNILLAAKTRLDCMQRDADALYKQIEYVEKRMAPYRQRAKQVKEEYNSLKARIAAVKNTNTLDSTLKSDISRHNAQKKSLKESLMILAKQRMAYSAEIQEIIKQYEPLKNAYNAKNRNMQEIVQAGLNTSCKINDGVNFQQFVNLLENYKDKNTNSGNLPCRLFARYSSDTKGKVYNGFSGESVQGCAHEFRSYDKEKRGVINVCGIDMNVINLEQLQNTLKNIRKKNNGKIKVNIENWDANYSKIKSCTF